MPNLLRVILLDRLRKAQPASKYHPAVAAELFDLDDFPARCSERYSSRSSRISPRQHTRSERAVVEHGFLYAGDEFPVGVLVVATSTLSMGVNMPTDVLLMHDHHTHTKKVTLDQYNDDMAMQRTATRPLS